AVLLTASARRAAGAAALPQEYYRRWMRCGCDAGDISPTVLPSRSTSTTLAGHCCRLTRALPLASRQADQGCCTVTSQTFFPSVSYSVSFLIHATHTSTGPFGNTSTPAFMTAGSVKVFSSFPSVSSRATVRWVETHTIWPSRILRAATTSLLARLIAYSSRP